MLSFLQRMDVMVHWQQRAEHPAVSWDARGCAFMQADNLVWAYDVVAIDEGQFMSGLLARLTL